MKSFATGSVAAIGVALVVFFAALAAGCVHTTIELPNGGGRYESTALFATRQAKSITVNLGPDKSVKVEGYGQDGTEVAKQALATATAALNKAP